MAAQSYRLDRIHHVIELPPLTDGDDLLAAEERLLRALKRCRTPVVIIDVRAAHVPTSALVLLLRARLSAERRRVLLYLTVRHPQVAETLREAGLEHVLRVTRTFAQVQTWSAVCCPASRRSPSGVMRTQLKARLHRFVCPDARWGLATTTQHSLTTRRETAGSGEDVLWRAS
ncbi:STAS domain-containing protein [Streptomyces sp. NPDC054842]